MYILAINPGSTSTKIAVYEDEHPLLVRAIRHRVDELAQFPRIIDQFEFRKALVLGELEAAGIPFRFDAIIGRGGLLKPIPGGVYEVNDAMLDDILHALHDHACNLGCLIAHELAVALPGCRALIADPGVVDELDDVARITISPIVGDIPQVKQSSPDSIVVRENRNELMEEIFRNLRTNLQYMLQEGQKVILFTSTVSNEGKSFNAANLAASFAFMEKKTVIVGMDIRKPSLSRIFNISDKEHGITEFLVSPSSTDLMQCCRQSSVSSHLYVLPCGTIPPNPTELVARPSLEKAIDVLKEHFDYVILDTAPIGMVTDTRLIARVADLCVYVCRADYTRKNEFEFINELEQDEKLPHFCVLINGIDMDKRKNGYHYGYGRYAKYGKYGHGRKYGSYYGYGKKQ